LAGAALDKEISNGLRIYGFMDVARAEDLFPVEIVLQDYLSK
jgi:hypothetical protein